MEFKTLTLGTLMGASLTMSQLAPAAIAHDAHPIITPIICDLSDESKEVGAFSRLVSRNNSHDISFGISGDGFESDVFAGLRIDAKGFPANNWKISGHESFGNSNSFEDLVFLTSMINSSGIFLVEDFDLNIINNNFTATFNESFPGDKFQSIYVYASGSSFTDLVDITHGVTVDGVLPVANLHDIALNDCTGFFGNEN